MRNRKLRRLAPPSVPEPNYTDSLELDYESIPLPTHTLIWKLKCAFLTLMLFTSIYFLLIQAKLEESNYYP